LFGVGDYFGQKERWGVFCVFSSFNAGGSVGGCMCVYTRTHTHTAHMGYSVVSPGVWDETPGGPGESKWTKSRHICIRVCVQNTHVYVYARRQDEISGLD